MPQPHPDGGTVWYGYVHDITERKAMEKELEDSHAFLTKLIDSLPDPIFVKDRDHKWLILNKANYEFAGIEQGTLIGKSDHDFFPKEEADIFWEKDEEVFTSGHVNVNEEYFTSSDGVIHYIQTIKAMFVGSDNKEYLVGTIRDLSERKKMEDALQSNRNLLHAILESSPGVITFALDKNYRYIAFNTQHADVMRMIFDIEIFIGMNMLEAIPSDSDREIAKRGFDRALSGESFTAEEEYGDERLSRKYWQIFYSPVHSETEEIIGLTCFNVDITERTKMEEALRSALEFNEGVISAIPDLLFEIAPDSTYVGVWAQDETLLAAQKELLLGKKFKDILPPDAVELSFAAMKEVDENGFSVGKTFSLDLPDGKRWFELSISKKQTSGNYIALSRDITARKVAEETIRELNTTLEQKVKERTLQLQHSLEFSEGVINALPDLLFEIDSNGTYLNIWARDEELLAAQKELLLGHTLHEMLSKESADTVLAALREADIQGTSFGKIITIDLPQGSRYFEQSVSKKASTNTFVVLSRDITERLEADKALRQSEETFRAIVENSPDVISRYDLQMRCTYINPLMQVLLGKPLDEVLGKTPREFSPLTDVDVFEHLFDTVVHGKNEIEYEGPFTAPWGEKRWGNQRLIPEFDEDRNVIGVMVVGRDMTERVETEKRLKLLETAVNNAEDGIFIVDDICSITYVNNSACTMLGYTRDELVKMKIYEIDTHLSKEELNGIENSLDMEKTTTFKTKHKTKNGHIMDVQVMLTYFEYDGIKFGVSLVKEIS